MLAADGNQREVLSIKIASHGEQALTAALRLNSMVCVSRHNFESLTFLIWSNVGPVWVKAWWYSISAENKVDDYESRDSDYVDLT